MLGIKLRFNENQNSSRADFLMTRNGQEIGVLEVTRSTVQKGEEIRRLIHNNPFIERKQCQSDWFIQLGENARINRVRKDADRYLRDIEMLGIDCFFCQMNARIEPVRKIWTELRVEAGWKTELKEPGIGIYAPLSGGRASPETVWQAVQLEAKKPDNLHKLRQSVGSNRHLFVVIDGLQGPAYASIRKCEPPQNIPVLPAEITHVWAAAEEGTLKFVWMADKEGWHNLTHKLNRNIPSRREPA